jgi:hypothetical protein
VQFDERLSGLRCLTAIKIALPARERIPVFAVVRSALIRKPIVGMLERGEVFWRVFDMVEGQQHRDAAKAALAVLAGKQSPFLFMFLLQHFGISV